MARRTLEAMQRDAQAADYFRKGMSYQQIADAMGWKSKNAAWQAVRRAVADSVRSPLATAERLSLMLERIQDRRRVLNRIVSTKHYLAGPGGKVVTVFDKDLNREVAVYDDGPIVRANTELRHLDELEARLLGLFAPSKKVVEVITQDAVDAECAELIEEMGLLDGSRPDHSGVPREP